MNKWLLLFLTQIFTSRINVKSRKSYINSCLEENQIHFYANQIQEYFNATKCFLHPDLSLEVLSREMKIPKHYFSQIFNTHIGKSFYTFIAEYRINYAIERLNTGSNYLKIESLAFECGFNSKTTFNKYFKSMTGLTPSEYQSTHKSSYKKRGCSIMMQPLYK